MEKIVKEALKEVIQHAEDDFESIITDTEINLLNHFLTLRSELHMVDKLLSLFEPGWEEDDLKPAPGMKLPPKSDLMEAAKKGLEKQKKPPVQEVIPEVVAPAPAKVALPAVKKPANQKYLGNKWTLYFEPTNPAITLYERHIIKNGMAYGPFYSTITKNGEKADVTFGNNCRDTWEINKFKTCAFMPGDCELQDRKGYLQIFIKEIAQFDPDSGPITVEE